MSTANHPQTNGQIEHVYRVLSDVLRSVCAEMPRRWSSMLPIVELAMNSAVHASTGYTPFYVNGLAHPRVPFTLPPRGSGIVGGEVADRLADISPSTVQKPVSAVLTTRLNVLRLVRDAMAYSQDKQKEQADAKGRSCIESYEIGDQVLLNAKNLPKNVLSAVFKTKLLLRFIGPFMVVAKKGLAYTLNLPRKCVHTPCFTFTSLRRIGIRPSLIGRRLRLRSCLCHMLLHPNQEVKLHLHPCLTRFKRRQASLHRVKRALGLTQSLAKTVHLVNQSLMGCSRHTDRHRHCLNSKGTSGSMWRTYFNDVGVMAKPVSGEVAGIP